MTPGCVAPLTPKGTVGDSLSSSQHPDVFVSSDGGYSWRGTLRGPHHYSILDSGGLIVAVEAQREGQVKTIKYDVKSPTGGGLIKHGRWKSWKFVLFVHLGNRGEGDWTNHPSAIFKWTHWISYC